MSNVSFQAKTILQALTVQIIDRIALPECQVLRHGKPSINLPTILTNFNGPDEVFIAPPGLGPCRFVKGSGMLSRDR